AAATLTHPIQLPDGLLELTFAGQATPRLAVLEISSYPDRRAAEQALSDAALVYLGRGVLPDVVTLVLAERGQYRLPSHHEAVSRTQQTRLGLDWTVVELWTIPQARLLALGEVGIIPLLPLAQTTEA